MSMSLTPKKSNKTENSINSSAIDVEAEKKTNNSKKTYGQERVMSSHYMNDPMLTTDVSLKE